MENSEIQQPSPVRSFEQPSSIRRIDSESSFMSDGSMMAAEERENLPHKSQSIVSLTTSALVGIFGSSLTDPSRSPTPELPGSSPSSSSANLYGDGVARLRRNEGGFQRFYGYPGSASGVSKPAMKRNSFSQGSDDADNAPSTGLNIFVKLSLLAIFGVAYGHLVTQLQDNHYVTTTTLNIDPTGSFTLTWGVLGILLGTLLPFVDSISPAVLGPKKSSTTASNMYAWNTIVRAVGIFIGISYGIRRLPWTSTLQGAAVLAFLNPILWFVMDTSVNGFALSSLSSILGTTVFACAYPTHFPQSDVWSEDYISVATWIASMFFCSSVCFGAIGRKLLGRSKL
ncbi:insulin-induced protein-domain-containing protein [Lipomyces arxii]|uniref:insulin-induced protein-domain-containing protein n=1 Tax=Lipomyces arxii TaxID=56418 RepID=UPI0034CEB12E